MDTTQTQGYALLLFLYLGAALGIVYDVLRLLRLAFDRRARRPYWTQYSASHFCLAWA